MEDPAITGVELEALIHRAAGRDREAVYSLLYCDWMTNLLEILADWSRRQFGVDGEEVRDHVFDKIRRQIEPPEEPRRKPEKPRPPCWLKNPHRKTLTECLNDWCFAVAKNHSLNIIRHRGIEQRHVESVEHENTQRIEHGVRIIEPSAPALSPEEELERKEREALTCKVHETARQAFDSSAEEEAKIASLWMEDKKLQQIADELGSSVETVRRKLKKLQQAIVAKVEKEIAEEVGEDVVKENGVAQILKELVEDRDDLQELLATGAKESAVFEHLPRAAA